MKHEEELLFYVQGRLSEQDKQAFETRLETDQALAAELAAVQTVRSEFANETRATADLSVGWADLQARIDAPPVETANDNHPIRLGLLQVAAVVGLAVVTWQFAIVPQFNKGADGFVTVSQESDAHMLQVVFRPDATLAEAATFLTQFDGTMSDGPSAVGVYRLRFDDAMKLEAAFEAANSDSNLFEFAAIE